MFPKRHRTRNYSLVGVMLSPQSRLSFRINMLMFSRMLHAAFMTESRTCLTKDSFVEHNFNSMILCALMKQVLGTNKHLMC